ncbi:hypothetical protein NLJ89_g5494 [Agrocybe chaxingu]|uniref:P-loop containing nucleoside triphosphate hydrolase protein n=1 Tax=Agrocybe chaxingu TaxID=84603 RepID=A0A9W8MUZ0_9AGAR|nr:hypothetical protein NLJ89_g5494 [Agrocybe chaxingu]
MQSWLSGFRYQGGGDTFFLVDKNAHVELDTRIVPLAVAAISLGCLVLQLAFHVVLSQFRKRSIEREVRDATPHCTHFQKIEHHVQFYGGYTIYAFMLARLVGVATLLYLSTVSVRQCNLNTEQKTCPESFFSLTYVHALFFALVSLTSKTWSRSAVGYASTTLLATFGIYAYRDLWPLMTYSQKPADIAEGHLLWAKIVILGTTAVFIPLFIPRRYVPVDNKNPMPIPNPEQTASWISRLTFTFMDPLVFLGSRVAHIQHSQLPPLCDEDWAKVQTTRAFPHVDTFYGAKRRHLFYGLMWHLRKEYVIMAVSLILTSIMSFVAPIGIKQVLSYLETRDISSTLPSDIRPGFWIGWLLFGPILESLTVHQYLFFATVVRVRLEVVITQLVFEHALRIRLKAEAAGDGGSKGGSKASSKAPSITEGASDSPETGSIEGDLSKGHAERDENETASTVVASTSDISPSRSASDSTIQETTSVSSTIKGKAKADQQPPDSKFGAKPELEEVPKKHAGDAENLLGKINNFVTTDLLNILEASDYLNFVLHVPMQIILCTIFLYQILGWSSIVGLVGTVALSPLAGLLGKKVQDVQAVRMKMTDARVQSITEAIGVLRMIKLFGWEGKMTARIQEKREEELKWIWRSKMLKLISMLISMFIPTLTMLATYITYTAFMKEDLNASKIFSSMAVFSILREQLHRIAWQTMMMIEGKVSLDRVNKFLQTAELLDAFAGTQPPVEPLGPTDDAVSTLDVAEEDSLIGFRNATFAWSAEDNDGALTPSSRVYRLNVDGELFFKRNCINLIIGPTGSGKTSMLMALLGEMHFIPSNPDSWFNLPRGGGVAYAAQESWVQNATIRENILFGSPYDEERYKKVINQCALERDLELFEARDATEVGEKGLTLSGGQKARVTLARAIYSPAKIVLLDDVLAALDVHTSAWIVTECFKGDLVKDRTMLLVTHNVALAGPVADFVVSIGVDGSVRTQGTEISLALVNDPKLASEVADNEKATDVAAAKENETIDKPKDVASADGKLVMAEEVVVGHVSWRTMGLLLDGLSEGHLATFTFIFATTLWTSQIIYTAQTWFLGVWGAQYEKHAASEVNLAYYIGVFTVIIVVHEIAFGAVNLWYAYRSVGASRRIHAKLIDSVLGSTLRWLDETPTARIIVRCTQDIRTIDGPIPQSLLWAVDQILGVLTKLGVIVLFTPIFLFPSVFVALAGLYLGNLYLKAQLSVKREMSNARSPLLAHFSAAIHGLVSIRAYGAQKVFKVESLKRIDDYARTARTSWNINRWIGFRIDLLGALFTSALATYLVYFQRVSASNTGFSLNMAVTFTMYIFWLIRVYNDLEVQSNSLERVQGYIDIEHETKPVESGRPPAAWPTSGDLRVENLSARYSQSGPKVLHDVSFHVKSGERVGIVGRTGSGKSSLTLALLRCIVTEGTVYYDGLPTTDINLDALRSNITIIPQTPELLSGTLRQNLDPFEQYDDATLNDALRSAGLFSLQDEAGEARITLDTKIAGGGGNLSVGQRQIIALARAMVRGSKLLILDEATSAIDYKTDTIIQSTLREQLGKDVTIITVAHRLQTIMDADKIMVLDSGHIVEFDCPKVLLRNQSGYLRALVDGSGDKSALYKLSGL